MSLILKERGLDVRPAPTSEPWHANDLAAEAVKGGASLVIAMGGDGTINEVMNGMAHSRVPLAVIPGGTANVFCCETGIPRNGEKAARQLSQWVETRVALGRLNAAGARQRHFLLMAGAGLDARIVRRVQSGIKRRAGKLAYWAEGFRAFGERLSMMKARAEGRELVTGFALTSRVRNYGGDLSIATKASLFADRFELVTFAGQSTLPYGVYLAGAVVAQATNMPGVHSVLTDRVELSAVNGDPIYVQVDGEAAGQLPASIDLTPSAITLLVPRSAIK